MAVSLIYATKLGFVEATYFEMDENGMDQLVSFNTDDGKILRDTMGRMASVATENIKKITTKKNDDAENDSPDNQ